MPVSLISVVRMTTQTMRVQRAIQSVFLLSSVLQLTPTMLVPVLAAVEASSGRMTEAKVSVRVVLTHGQV